jgi:hypothetical protein
MVFSLSHGAAQTSPQPSSSDSAQLWTQVLDEAKTYDCHRFRLTWTLKAAVKDRTRQIIARYEGRATDAKTGAGNAKTGAGTWALVSVDGQKPSAKDVEQIQKRSLNRPPLCYKTVASYAEAKLLTQTDTTATYSLTGLSKTLESELKDNKMMLNLARAATTIITVRKGPNPYVTSIKSTISTPVKTGVATIKQLERIIRFERRQDGYLYVLNEETTKQGSAFFVDFTSKNLSSYQDIERL